MSARARAKERWKLAASNSQFEDSNCPPSGDAVARKIGVDTVSWCWKDPRAVDRFLRLDGHCPPGDDSRPLRVVPAPGRAVRLSRRLDGLGTVGVFPGASMLFVEGRASALRKRDETDHGLARPRKLLWLEQQLEQDLGELLDIRAAGAQLRRVDLAGELRFDRGEDGRQLLTLLDHLHSPNHKTSPVRERGGPGIETAYWRTPKRSIPVLRAYDKGVESGTAPAGERVRLERQLRYQGAKRPSLEQWLERDLGDLYAAPIRSWIGTGGVIAGDANQLLRLLTDAGHIWPSFWTSGPNELDGGGHHRRGMRSRAKREKRSGPAGDYWCRPAPAPGSSSAGYWRPLWSAAHTERVIGTLAVIDHYGKAWGAWSPKQTQRRMREVRELGLVLLEQPNAVDVDQLVNQLCDDWRRAA